MTKLYFSDSPRNALQALGGIERAERGLLECWVWVCRRRNDALTGRSLTAPWPVVANDQIAVMLDHDGFHVTKPWRASALRAIFGPLPEMVECDRCRPDKRHYVPIGRCMTCSNTRKIPQPFTFDSRWLSSTVRDLARAVRGDCSLIPQPDTMPILGDALKDAGCDSEEIDRHCQGLERCGCEDGRERHFNFTTTHFTCKGSGWRPRLCGVVQGDWVMEGILNPRRPSLRTPSVPQSAPS